MKTKHCQEGDHQVPSLFWRALPNRKSACMQCAKKHFKPISKEVKMIQSDRPSNKPVQAVKKPKPISKLSDKEKKRQAAYTVLKKEYMKQYPECQVKLEGCVGKSVDIHHLFFGADRYGHFLDSTSWKSTCRSCHTRIHDEFSSEQLIEMGLRKKE